ncbi:MAG: hypothetical protein RKE49_14440 [Oceanicaulis sp.]
MAHPPLGNERDETGVRALANLDVYGHSIVAMFWAYDAADRDWRLVIVPQDISSRSADFFAVMRTLLTHHVEIDRKEIRILPRDHRDVVAVRTRMHAGELEDGRAQDVVVYRMDP